MKNEGFTLIEVLAVIVLLGLLSVLIVPNFFNINKKEKDKANDSLIKVIESAAEIYGENNANLLKSNYEYNNVVVKCNSDSIKDITNTSDSIGCVCEESNDCHYLVRITVKDLITSGLLDEQNNNNECLYLGTNGECLDCYSILLTIDDESFNTSAKFENKKLNC